MVNKNYQENNEKLQKEARERYQNLSVEEKEKNVSIIAIETKIFLKNKNKKS